MKGQVQLAGIDWSGMGAVDIHDLILPEQPHEDERARSSKEAEAPRWEVAFSSGADVAVRRMKGTSSAILALIPAKGQYYLWDEGRDTRKPLTGARIASFFKGCRDASLIPWFVGEPCGITTSRGEALLATIRNDAANALLRRGLIFLDASALDRLSGSYGRRSRPDYMDARYEAVSKMLVSCLLSRFPKDEVASFLSERLGAEVERGDAFWRMASLSGYADKLSTILECLGLDSARKLVYRFLDSEDENATELYSVGCVLDRLKSCSVEYEPKVLCRYALSHWGSLGDWSRYTSRVLYDCGTIGDPFPRDPADALAAYERRLYELRSQGIREGFASRISALSMNEWEDGDYLIRLPRTASELEREGSALHHCVGSFASRHARAQTTIWLMRRADAPEEPYVTVEVAGRQVRQAHGLCNRNLTPAEGAWLKAWCKRSGYRYDSRTAQGVRG